MDVLLRMQHAIREQRYRISSHANDEMADDFLVAADIESIILTGEITRKFTHDPRGTGMKCSAIPLTTVVRMSCVVFLLSGGLLIITAYAGKNHGERDDER